MREQPAASDPAAYRREDPQLSATPRNVGVDAAVAAARRVIASLLLAGDGSAAEMEGVAAQLHAVADHLDEQAPSQRERMVDMWSGEGYTRHDPVTGPENAVAPPLRLTGHPDGSVSGTVTLGLPYQGPPGCVHGGVSALLLDHTLGVANGWAGVSGMTGTLTVRYRRTTPLFEPLTVSARQERVEGRKIWTTGTITTNDGQVCVSAEGLFVAGHPPRPR